MRQKIVYDMVRVYEHHHYHGRITRFQYHSTASIEERYRWIESVARKFRYSSRSLSKKAKGEILSFCVKLIGLSRPQVKRLLNRYQRYGRIIRKLSTRHKFPCVYTTDDVAFRVDTVHQGDLEKVKGVYYINLVDEVTQWEVVACVLDISELFFGAGIGSMSLDVPFSHSWFPFRQLPKKHAEAIDRYLKDWLVPSDAI